MSLAVRKVFSFYEETLTEGGRSDGDPLRKAVVGCVIANPFAGEAYAEDLSALVDPSAELGQMLGERAVSVLGAPVDSYGKASLVGVAGEQEHAIACVTSTFGDALRDAIGGATAWLPSVSKRCAPGTVVDVPICFKDEIWVRSHYDTVSITVHDGPLPDEIVVLVGVASRGRLNARLGGKSKDEALAAR
jgi:hypothetical protein